MKAALQEDLGAAKVLSFPNFIGKFGKTQQIALLILGSFEKRAEFTGGDADIGIIDIPVNDIGHEVFRMFAATNTVGEETEPVKVRVLCKDHILFVVDPAACDYFFDDTVKLHSVHDSFAC
jgi:hypothetical protein